MSEHKLSKWFLGMASQVADPGASGTVNLANKGYAVLKITTAAAEARTIPAPEKAGQRLQVCLKTDGGDATVAVTSGHNVSSVVLDDAGDSFELVAVDVGGTIKWAAAWASGPLSGFPSNLGGNADIPGTLTVDGTAYIGDSANAAVTLGLTINQGAADDNILALKSSDVATGLTTIVTGTVETDDYCAVSKFAAATGGLLIQGLGENAAVTTNMRLESYGGQASTTHTSAGRALFEVAVHQHDGANALAAVAADGNVFGIRANQGGTETTVWMVDEDGAPQSIVDHAAFDEHDDIALIRTLERARSGGQQLYGYVKSKFDDYLKGSEDQLVDIGVLGCPMPKSEGDERPMLNLKRLAMLQNGALVQLFQDLMEVVSALPEESRAKLNGRVAQRLALAAG